MINAQEQAAIRLAAAIFGAATLQLIIRQNATALGLTTLELTLLGAAATALIARVVR